MRMISYLMLGAVFLISIPCFSVQQHKNNVLTHGGKRMLAIRPIYDGDSKELAREIEDAGDEINYLYDQLDLIWKHSSYGKLWVEHMDTIAVHIHHKPSRDSTVSDDDEARQNAAIALGLKSVTALKKKYDFITLIYHEDQNFRGGKGRIGGENAKIGAYNYNTLAHEMDHNLGQGGHPGCWISYDKEDPVNSSGIYIPNGHPFGALGGYGNYLPFSSNAIRTRYQPLDGCGNRLGYVLQTRQLFGWVNMGTCSTNDIRIIDKSQKIRIYRYDVSQPKNTLGVLIDRAGSLLKNVGPDSECRPFDHYLLSFVARKEAIANPLDGDRKLPANLPEFIGNGLVVERVIYDKKNNLLRGTTIIDCNPQTLKSKIKEKSNESIMELSDCFLKVGQTLTDKKAGISITTLAIGGDGFERYIDVEIILN